jgi:hypothetical protein
MSDIPLQGGKVLLRDGKVGTEQACCCVTCRCDLECPEFAGAEVSVTGTRVGTVNATIPNDDPEYEFSSAPLCDLRPFDGGKQIIWSLSYVDDTGLVVSATFDVACGSEFGLEPGEYFITVTALVGTPPDDPSTIRNVSWQSIYTDCDGNGLPDIDTNNMIQNQCVDGDNNQLDPCPVRIRSRLILA